MQKLLVANWKENPKTENEAVALFRAAAKVRTSKGIQTVICPPFVYLEKLANIARTLEGKNRVALGAQDVFWEKEGPFTGDISPVMLKNLDVGYVIIGHSERRQWLGETDAMINKKIRATLDTGLRVIVCVGESVGIRKKGVREAQKFLGNQLAKDLKGISRSVFPGKLIIAYEPIWAISTSGTGRNASPADARNMVLFVKKQLHIIFRLPIASRPSLVLYGGSVNSKNICDYIQCKEIDGALVGDASLKANEWKRIVSTNFRH